jgi:hypothetical protein
MALAPGASASTKGTLIDRAERASGSDERC